MTIVQPTLWGDLDDGWEAQPGPATSAGGRSAGVRATGSARPTRAHDTFTALRGHTERIVAHSSDRVAWLRARAMGITATDVARLASLHAVDAVVADKRYGSRFAGNVYTEHGKEREPVIASWVAATHGIQPSAHLFHAATNRAHLATPDGVGLDRDGRLLLAEIKTTANGFTRVPRHYMRQVWWQQYVLGADRTLFVWEKHDDFVPVADEPECRWIDRDDDAIRGLIALADLVLDRLRDAR
ncbi:YqaJ viral recombinase family protein [Curtobacterium sp. MCLR17_032]|uniref:YqaJ viral recombinase family protein n=1 Tax=Curtobacterium sp. MCLR17_032 TaxID=2175650 RepID=UPI000DAA4134|nr:YqaJ viral recombinase family protein [Curtobacterium sp. MCLR17_032]WIE60423.1 YqaJ viral recombinase family protein [Curtobacterium sp. MCLR17_032]